MLFSDFLEKPSVVKYYGEKLISNYPEKLIQYEKKKLVSNAKIIQSILSYVSFDIICNNIEFLEVLEFTESDLVIDWIQSNVKLESFMNMINRYYQKVGCIELKTYMNDIFGQLEKLLKKSVVVSRPKRWRMVDFHDHISYLYICNTTHNQPIKTIINPTKIDNYMIKQPEQTLDIVFWGNKVKNCVASREERIGKGTWIFFIEKDESPLYTVETDKKFNITEIQMVGKNSFNTDNEHRELASKLIMKATK